MDNPIDKLESTEEIEATLEARLAQARVYREGLDAEIARIEGTLAVLRGKPVPKKRGRVRKAVARKSSRPGRSRVGPRDLARVTDALREMGGRASQHALTKTTGLNSGTVSYALRKLTEDGKVQATGKLEGRSPVYAQVRSTRRAPGSVS